MRTNAVKRAKMRRRRTPLTAIAALSRLFPPFLRPRIPSHLFITTPSLFSEMCKIYDAASRLRRLNRDAIPALSWNVTKGKDFMGWGWRFSSWTLVGFSLVLWRQSASFKLATVMKSPLFVRLKAFIACFMAMFVFNFVYEKGWRSFRSHIKECCALRKN